MAAIVGIISRRGLRIEVHHRNQPNKSKLVLYKPLLRLYSHLKQPYISNKTKWFSYKGGCGVRGRTLSRRLKEELAWVTYKRLRLISNIMFYTTKKLKNKAVLSLNNIVCVAKWSLVTYSYCLVIYN